MNVQSLVEDLTQVCMEIRRNIQSSCIDRQEKEKLLLRHFKEFASKDVRINEFKAEKREYASLLILEKALTRQLAELTDEESKSRSMDETVNLLHRYNEIKDATQAVVGLEWFNVSEGLSIKGHLSGKIVILDFFTYCCINCMHILPDLNTLERRFSVEDGLLVIGVHSAKFSNERDSKRLLAAVQRYKITHPVVNDTTMSTWQDLGIVCWPTLVLLGPASQPLAVFVGEGHKEELFLYVEVALKYFKGLNQISGKSLPLESERHLLPLGKGSLLFPGKLKVFPSKGGERLVVSDSGNNRILVVSTAGKVECTVGGDSPGFRDGDFENARFNAPQGVCTIGDTIYVADSENHSVRKIDLTARTVTTVAGTGFQGHDYVGGKTGTEQPLSSPWDIAVYYHAQERTNVPVPVLLIAVAGTHQIWALFLEETVWWKKRTYKTGTCIAIVGSGREENRNNTYPHAAGLAQPSGLAVAQENKVLYFADSESSAIRIVDLESGRVSALCGGNRNPSDLHDFGDVDGTQYSAKLQHPLGVTWHPQEKIVYVADTYNHKIKKVDTSGRCKTVYGNGRPTKAFKFDEPSGIAVDSSGQVIYVADTNNHAVKILHVRSEKISTLPIQVPRRNARHLSEVYDFDLRVAAKGGELNITFNLTFEDNVKLNDDSPQRWSVNLPVDTWEIDATTGVLSRPISIKVPQGDGVKALRVTLDVVICKTNECIPKQLGVVYNVRQETCAPSIVTETTNLLIRQ